MTGGGEGDPARVTAPRWVSKAPPQELRKKHTSQPHGRRVQRLEAEPQRVPGGHAKRQAWEGGGAAGGGQKAGVLPPSRAAGEGLVPFSRYPGPKSCARRHVCCWQEFSEAVGWM